MLVRELQRTELGELLGLYSHLHAADAPLPPEAQVAAVWEAILASPAIKCFGAFAEGRLVASCVLSITPNLTRGCRPYGLIENVVTDAAFRRQGYGRAVLQHALKCAWQAECYKVMLLTGRKDARTSAFYESVGFDRDAKQAFLAKPE